MGSSVQSPEPDEQRTWLSHRPVPGTAILPLGSPMATRTTRCPRRRCGRSHISAVVSVTGELYRHTAPARTAEPARDDFRGGAVVERAPSGREPKRQKRLASPVSKQSSATCAFDVAANLTVAPLDRPGLNHSASRGYGTTETSTGRRLRRVVASGGVARYRVTESNGRSCR